MATRSILACAAAACALGLGPGLALPTPAGAEVVAWRATGTVSSLQGTAGLLPLPATPGDSFVIDFSYDDTAADESAFADRGSYPLLSLVVTVDGQGLEYAGPGVGVGHISIQANAVDPNLWGASACLPTCSNVTTYDQARINFFFPPATIPSDALTPPPDPTGATVQFGLFSRTPSDEAFVIASLISVPAPGADASALAALAALGAVACSATARRRPGR